MKKSLLCGSLAVMVCLLVGCKGNDATPNSVIDAVCGMYGQSIDKAKSSAKSQGFKNIEEIGSNAAVCYKIDSASSTSPTEWISLESDGSKVINIEYVVSYSGTTNLTAAKAPAFLQSIGNKRVVNGGTFIFWEGAAYGESAEYFNEGEFKNFVIAAGSAEVIRAAWDDSSEKSGCTMHAESDYKDGVTYLVFTLEEAE